MESVDPESNVLDRHAEESVILTRSLNNWEKVNQSVINNIDDQNVQEQQELMKTPSLLGILKDKILGKPDAEYI